MRKPLGLAAVIMCLAAVSGTAQAQTRTWTGLGTTDNWSDAGNWSGGVAPVNGNSLVWDATSTARLSSNNDLSNLSVVSITYSAAPAGVVLSGNAFSLTAATPLVGSTTGRITINNNVSLASNANSFGNSAGIVLNGIISGGSTGSMTPSASATQPSAFYALYGLNTFTASTFNLSNWSTTSVIANTLANSGVAQSLGTGGLVQFGAGTSNAAHLYYTGGATSTNKGFAIGDNNGAAHGAVFANGTGALTWEGAQTVRTKTQANSFTLGGFNADANTWTSSIANNNLTGGGSALVNFTKAGRGSWTLSGSNSFSGTFTVNSGRLVLDYATTPTVVATTLAPVLGGGTLEFKAAGSGSSAQTLGNVTATARTGLSTIRVDTNNGAGMAVTTGSLTVTAGQSALFFDLYESPGSTITVGTAIKSGTSADGVIAGGGRYILRTSAGEYDFAVNGGNAANPLSALGATEILGATNGNLGTDYRFTNSGTVGGGGTASITTASLRIAPTQNDQTMTIANSGGIINNSGVQSGTTGASVGGVIYDGGNRNFTIAAADAITTSIRTANNQNPLYFYHLGTGTLTIGERVNLTRVGSAGVLGLFGAGGLIDWKGGMMATSAGSMTVSGLTVRISGTVDPVQLGNGTTGVGEMNIALNGGGVLEAVNGNITRNVGTGAGAIQWTGDGGFSAFGGNRAVNLGGVSAAVTWGGTNFVPSDNALLLSSQYSDSTIDFQNPVALGTLQRVVQVANGSAAVDARLSGVLSSSLTGGLVKEGAGTLELTAANTYFGETWVRAGGLLVNGDQSAANGALRVFAGATLGGTGSLGSASALISGAVAPGLPGALGTLTFAGSALNFSTGGSLLAELNLNPAVFTSDLLDISGAGSGLTLGGTSILDLVGPTSFTSAGTYTLATFASGSRSGEFTTVRYNGTTYATPTSAGGVTANGQLVYNDTSLQLVVVPEPAALALAACGIGLAGLAAWRRRRA